MSDPPLFGKMGWLGIDARQIAAAAPFPKLTAAAPHLFGAPPRTEPVLLYKAWLDVLKGYPPYPAQEIGDCVSHGHGHANDLSQCVEIATGEASEYRETDTEYLYAASRKAAGILGSGDGSYGSAAVQAMTSGGIVSREMLGAEGNYSGTRAREWGRTGPPAALEREASAFKLGAAARVFTWDELIAAIENGYPVTVCSNQGFALVRDAQGFCQAQGEWGHCMFMCAIRFDRPGALICQSWGDQSPSGPRVWDQPPFSFWADRTVIERMLAQGDSWSLSQAPNFVEKELPKHWQWNRGA